MNFIKQFDIFLKNLKQDLMESDSSWVVKGFIDTHKNIYPISTDTKIISKLIELLIFPKIFDFAYHNGFIVEPAQHQNHYPDITLIDSQGIRYALDLKSTYRTNDDMVNGMTLGAFTGYFRNRDSSKNILYPYASYKKHYVLGVIYTRLDGVTDAFKTFNLDTLSEITSSIKDIDLFIQEKWKIATDKLGSGNTKNIGSEKNISKLKSGQGLFYNTYGDGGDRHFHLYWSEYETKDMAVKAGRDTPRFHNIPTYESWCRKIGKV